MIVAYQMKFFHSLEFLHENYPYKSINFLQTPSFKMFNKESS